MDIKGLLEKTMQLIKKYRYAVLVLVIGLILMALPGANGVELESDTTACRDIADQPALEEKLAQILSQVDGAGEVRVILTVAAGEEVIYQTNSDVSTTNDSNSTNYDTVTVNDADRNENGLIRQVNPAVYQGAIIVCQGADDPVIKLKIVDAVSKLTGLGTNCISVLKMK